ncbi:MAG: hypothetical protein QOD98_1344, partial [Nocardioidaceae bacterium]|nr:hypothetical protein [Nocardioidaceae bacterium]
ADSMNATGQAAQDLLDKLNGQIGAFKSGQAAADALGSAMGGLAAHFGDAAVASEDGIRTTGLFAKAMQDVGDNSLSAADKVGAFASAFQSASDVPRTFFESQLKANEALTKFNTALDKVPPGLIAANGALDSTTAAGQKVGNAIGSLTCVPRNSGALEAMILV